MRWDADRDTDRANDLVTELVGRAHDSGRLRADSVAHGIGLLLEGCAAAGGLRCCWRAALLLEGCAAVPFRTRTGPASHRQR